MKKKKQNQLWNYVSIASFVLIVGIFSLAFFLAKSGEEITGSTIQVNYYGAINPPLNLYQICTNSDCKKGVQTKVGASQPELGMLKAVESLRIKTARKIIQAFDLNRIYQESVPFPFSADALETVQWASESIVDNFVMDTSCFALVGQNYGPEKEFEFVIISYFSYEDCPSYPAWSCTAIKHEFRTKAGELICSQESEKLFTIEKSTGTASKSVVGC